MRLGLNRFAGLLAAKSIGLLMGQVKLEQEYENDDWNLIKHGRMPQSIFVFWHEYMITPFYAIRGNPITVLVSQHRDAEVLMQACRSYGYNCVRGSSTRGGITAIKKLMKADQSLGITPDGPKGPRRQVKSGCVYLSSRLGIPIIPTVVAYEKAWRLQKAWDQFAIPKPWSRANLILGKPISVDPDAKKDEIDDVTQHVQAEMDRLTEKAERF